MKTDACWRWKKKLKLLGHKTDLLEKTLHEDPEWLQRISMRLALSDDSDKEQLDVLKQLGVIDK